MRPCFPFLGESRGLIRRNLEFFFAVPLFSEAGFNWFTCFVGGQLRVFTSQKVWGAGVDEVVSYSSWLVYQKEQSRVLP